MTESPTTDLIDQYIDATARLEQCEKLQRYDLGRTLKDTLYDHKEVLEKQVRELKMAIERDEDEA